MRARRRPSAGRPPVPGQKLGDLIDRMVGDAGSDVAQVGLGVEPIHLCGLDESVHGGGPNAAGIGAGEQIVLAGQRNLAAILPMSGKMWWSDIAGIRCTDRGCVVFRASSAHRVSWCMWS